MVTESKKPVSPGAIALATAIFTEDITRSKLYISEHLLRYGLFWEIYKATERHVALLDHEKYEEGIQGILDAFEKGTRIGEVGRLHDVSLDERLSWRKRKLESAVPTGLPLFDEVLGGGLFPGQLMVLLGGTGVGKTTGSILCAYGAAQADRKVLLISAELSREEIETKLDCKISGIRSDELLSKEPELIAKIKKFYKERRGQIHVAWFELGTATVHDLRGYYRHLKQYQSFAPDLVIIDSPDNLKAMGRHSKKFEALEEIYAAVFGWAGADRIPIVVTSDVKQASRKKRLIGVEDAGGSYEKVKKADIVIGLGCDSDMRKEDDRGEFIIWANFDKVRTGRGGVTFQVKVNPATSSWSVIRALESEEAREAPLKGKGGSTSFIQE